MKCLDVSSNNHDGTVFNWQAAKDAGYDAVYVKATQNDNYVNPYLIGDCKDARNAGLEVGVYHFYGTSQPGTANPISQADWFKRNGIEQVILWTTLSPVVDVEVGTPGQQLEQLVEEFISELKSACGVYLNRDFQTNMPNLDTSFLWLAWPGWTNEAVPSHTAMVQTGKVEVPGIGETGKLTDISEILDETLLGTTAPEPTQQEEVIEMDSIVATINGVECLVSHVLTQSGHYLEVVRPLHVVGTHAENDGTEIIDLTDAYPTISWH